MNATSDQVVTELDVAANSPSAARVIADTLARVIARLEGTDGPMTWEAVPLSVFAGDLSALVRSCWVFALRPGVKTEPERHPNSHQRSLSLSGAGRFELLDRGEWTTHALASGPAATAGNRWVSIPPNTWHRLYADAEPWGMLSFHTVEASELVQEVPVDPDDLEGPTAKHVYEAE